MRDDRGLLEADAPTQRLDARRAAMSETTIPSRSTTRPADVPRPVGGLSLEQVLMAVGSGVSSVSLAALLFGQIAPLSGKLGFVVVQSDGRGTSLRSKGAHQPDRCGSDGSLLAAPNPSSLVPVLRR